MEGFFDKNANQINNPRGTFLKSAVGLKGGNHGNNVNKKFNSIRILTVETKNTDQKYVDGLRITAPRPMHYRMAKALLKEVSKNKPQTTYIQPKNKSANLIYLWQTVLEGGNCSYRIVAVNTKGEKLFVWDGPVLHSRELALAAADILIRDIVEKPYTRVRNHPWITFTNHKTYGEIIHEVRKKMTGGDHPFVKPGTIRFPFEDPINTTKTELTSSTLNPQP